MRDEGREAVVGAEQLLREVRTKGILADLNYPEKRAAEWAAGNPGGNVEAFRAGWLAACSAADWFATAFEQRFRHESRRLGLRDFRVLVSSFAPEDRDPASPNSSGRAPLSQAVEHWADQGAPTVLDRNSFIAGWSTACQTLEEYANGMEAFGWPLNRGTIGIGTWRSSIRAFATGVVTAVPNDDAAPRWTMPTRIIRATIRFLETGDTKRAEQAFKGAERSQDRPRQVGVTTSDQSGPGNAGAALEQPTKGSPEGEEARGEAKALALYISLHEGETHPALDMQLREMLQSIRTRAENGELRAGPIRVYGDVAGRLHAPRKRQIERCLAQLRAERLPALLGFDTALEHDRAFLSEKAAEFGFALITERGSTSVSIKTPWWPKED